MILRELTIKNFRSYYGEENKFVFNPDGLTLIIGDNGDGKTTFLESLEWLFDTTAMHQRNDSMNISEMRKSRMVVGEEDEVRVTIKFDHDGEKELNKSFTFKKIDTNRVQIISREFVGYEFDGIQRSQVSGDIILKRCFDAEIRKYSLFKGETQLDIFHQDSEALKRLLTNFSDIKRLDQYAEITRTLNDLAAKAHDKELKNDKKTATAADMLSRQMGNIQEQMGNIRRQIRDQEANSRTYKTKLDALVDNRDVKEKLDAINERIKNHEEQYRRAKSYTVVDYNTSLLDESWILCAFPTILDDFQKKSSAFSKEKRKQHNAFLIEKGKQEQLRELSLPDGISNLPWYMPDEKSMEEMVNEEICKVCGRKAPKGSEAYEFMQNKLQAFLKHKKAKIDTEVEDLFTSNYIEELHNFSISYSGPKEAEICQLFEVIKDRLEFIKSRQEDAKKWENAVSEAKDEKSRLLAQLNGVSEDDIMRSATDVRDFMSRRDDAERKLGELKLKLSDLNEKENELEEQYSLLKPTNKEAERYGRIHNVFDHIYKAFLSARETNRRNFLNRLAELSNQYLSKLNVTDFHGVIEIYRHQESENIDVILKSENGTYVTSPSESQKTTMYMSVLFAIAKITADLRETEYPLIFDAPTSSFSEMKETEFYEIINKIQKQCIIVTKDMLTYDAEKKTSTIKDSAFELSCPIYRIEKEKDFNPNDLSTIRVITTKIKD